MNDQIREAPIDAPAPDDGWEWAAVEIFGHRSHAGRCREVERFGVKLIRIDIPIKGDPVANGWETHFYPGSSLFSYTPTDESSVMRANKPYEASSRYRLPSPGRDVHGEFVDHDDDQTDDGCDYDDNPPAAALPDPPAEAPDVTDGHVIAKPNPDDAEDDRPF